MSFAYLSARLCASASKASHRIHKFLRETSDAFSCSPQQSHLLVSSYLFRSAERFNSEYALGDVIVSLAEALRLIGVSNPLNTSILAMQDMKPKDFKLMLKFLKKIEQRFARTRSRIERYLQYQSQF